MLLNKITVIGVGLIGGSFAKGLKDSGLVKQVVGFGSREANLQTAVQLGVVDGYVTDMAEALTECDLVMLATPVGSMQSVLKAMQPYLEEQTIITDGGSSKESVIQAVEAVLGKRTMFVPGHPIAGKEQSGVTAACADLYQDHRVILTPTEYTDKTALQTVKQLWQALGANIEEMEPCYHDEVLAATSHLPHLLAFGLVDLLHEHEELGNVFQFTAGGFRDFTRIASSDATMWRDISIHNRTAIVKWLKNYQAELTQLTEFVEQSDGEALFDLFTEAKQARDTHIVAPKKQPAEDDYLAND